MKLKSLELNEIGHIAESEIYRYIREIETNESQYLGGLLREIYEKSLQGMRFLLNFHLKKSVLGRDGWFGKALIVAFLGYS